MSEFRFPSAASGFQAEDAEHAMPAEHARAAPEGGFQAEDGEHASVTPEYPGGAGGAPSS
jgi:hypothetical protein